jgi:hypothetical protein
VNTLQRLKYLLPILIMALLFSSCDTENPLGTFEEVTANIPNFTPISGADNVTVQVTTNQNRSNFNVNISNIGDDSPFYNGDYLGWCADWVAPIEGGKEYGGITLYSTRGDKNWNKLNYLLNEKNNYFNDIEGITWREIQAVIWTLIEYKEYDVNTNSNLNRDAYDAVLNDVNQNGDMFRHGPGTTHAVFADMSVQETNSSPVQTLLLEETAWAYAGEENSDTFIELGLDEKWGWVIYYTVGGDPLTFEYWMGAGQNNLENGEQIGEGIISSSNGEVTIYLELFDNLFIGDIHIWADTDYPPSPVAPGQFQINLTFDPVKDYHTEVISRNPGDELKIAIHSGEIYRAI